MGGEAGGHMTPFRPMGSEAGGHMMSCRPVGSEAGQVTSYTGHWEGLCQGHPVTTLAQGLDQ